MIRYALLDLQGVQRPRPSVYLVRGRSLNELPLIEGGSILAIGFWNPRRASIHVNTIRRPTELVLLYQRFVPVSVRYCKQAEPERAQSLVRARQLAKVCFVVSTRTSGSKWRATQQNMSSMESKILVSYLVGTPLLRCFLEALLGCFQAWGQWLPSF